MSHYTTPEDEPRLKILEAGGIEDAPDLDEPDLPHLPDGVPGALRALDAGAGADASGLPADALAPQSEASSFLIGPDAVRDFVAREWTRRLDYRLKKEVWTYSGDQVSILFEYEWHDAETEQWMLTHGEEHWEIGADGLLHRIKSTGQDIPIAEIDRLVPPRPIWGPTLVD